MSEQAHGQELTDEFLDELFVSVRDKVPSGKWVEITKNYDQVVAGLKHLIDHACYGHNMDIVFNNEFTHFKKTVYPQHKPPPFEGKYLTNHTADYWTKQDELALENNKKKIERERRKLERESQPKFKKRGSRK